MPSPSTTTRPSFSRASTASRSRSIPGRRRCRDELERRGPTLAERPLESALLASRLVAGSSGGALGSQRAGVTAGDPSEADRGPEIHECLCGGTGEAVAGPPLDAVDIDVVREHILAEGEVADRRCGVRPDAGEVRQVIRPAFGRDQPRCAVERECAPVVAEALPGTNHLIGRGGCKVLGRRPALEPGEIPGHDAVDLCLLQHHFAYEDGVRVRGVAPGQIPFVQAVPGQQQLLHESDRT